MLTVERIPLKPAQESIAVGRSADALSTALLTQTELSITVRAVALTGGGALDIWTRAPEVTPQKGEVTRWIGSKV